MSITKQEAVLDFDFGFTAVDADELDVVRKQRDDLTDLNHTNQAMAAKSQMLYDMVVPLINNLKQNPEKDYIYWPNRYEKLDLFEAKLYAILNGE
tara:strand:- start:16 stop:300 length:285 start_codon:yes stop_codon:yes gene_type:complete